jgi:Spy/CpxP family protein refolding chaperone
MSISTLFGTRLLTGLGALALTGTLAGGTAIAGETGKHEVRDLHHELRDDTKAEREEISALRKQLAAEYAKETPDTSELRRLHDAIEAKRDAISDMRFETMLTMHEYLDAKQRERVAERIAGKDKAEHEDKAERKDERKADGKGKPEGKGKGKGKDKAERGKGKDKDKDKSKDKREDKDESDSERHPI